MSSAFLSCYHCNSAAPQLSLTASSCFSQFWICCDMLCWDACQWTRGQERWTEAKKLTLVGFRKHETKDHRQNSGVQGICQIEICLNPGLIWYMTLNPKSTRVTPQVQKLQFQPPPENKSITSKFSEDFCNCNSFWNSSTFADFQLLSSVVFCNYSNFNMGFESQLQQFQWFRWYPQHGLHQPVLMQLLTLFQALQHLRSNQDLRVQMD